MLGPHIHHCEDSLTGAVFSTLLHLPEEMFWEVLREAVKSPRFPVPPVPPVRLEEVQPWPAWDGEGTGNSRLVEPDLFLRFSGLDLIVEAK